MRPGEPTNRAARGIHKHGSGVGNVLWTVHIPRADVAAFMLDQLDDARYGHAPPGVR